MGKIKWTEKASSHLQIIYEYIAEDSKIYATRFIKSLILSTKKLKSMPKCGRKVPEFEDYDFREVIFRNYRIIYRISEENKDIEILSVFHSARDLKKAVSEEWEL